MASPCWPFTEIYRNFVLVRLLSAVLFLRLSAICCRALLHSTLAEQNIDRSLQNYSINQCYGQDTPASSSSLSVTFGRFGQSTSSVSPPFPESCLLCSSCLLYSSVSQMFPLYEHICDSQLVVSRIFGAKHCSTGDATRSARKTDAYGTYCLLNSIAEKFKEEMMPFKIFSCFD